MDAALTQDGMSLDGSDPWTDRGVIRNITRQGLPSQRIRSSTKNVASTSPHKKRNLVGTLDFFAAPTCD